MPKIAYITKKIGSDREELLFVANQIIDSYGAQGYRLTLRQLYYQMIARDLFPASWIDRAYNIERGLDPDTKNTMKNYKRFGELVNDGRMTGIVDWDAIEDRGRALNALSHWDTPADIIDSARHSFRLDKWEGQKYRPECFPPDTPVISIGGYLPIGEIKVGDLVLADDGEYRKVSKIHRRPYRGEVVRIKPIGLPAVTCTPEHPVFAKPHDKRFRSRGAEKKFLPAGFVCAENLKNEDVVSVPRILATRDVESISFSPGPRRKLVGSVPFDLAFCAIVGVYLAEGSVKPDRRTLQFVIHKNEDMQASAILEWASSVGANTSVSVKGGAMTILLFSKAASDWFSSQFGDGAFNKRFPEWFMYLPFDKQMATLKHYYLGDGAKALDDTRSALSLTTRSEILARQSQILFFRLGYGATLHTSNDHGKPRYGVGVSGQYGEDLAGVWGIPLTPTTRRYNYIKIDDSFTYHPIDFVLREHYDGEVVNLEVEEKHTYCVPFVVHNCWVEKEAMEGVLQRICNRLDVPFFASKGYNSQTAEWEAARRLEGYIRGGQTPIIFYLGDHDPSGIDMTRDHDDRLRLFMGGVIVDRIALNYDQVQQYNPPPNPAKESDSRIAGYRSVYGDDSWELDALEPQVISDLIRVAVEGVRDEEAYNEVVAREQDMAEDLMKASSRWDEVVDFLNNN